MSLEKELEDMVAFAEEQISILAKQKQFEQELAKQMPIRFEKNIQAFNEYLPKIAEEFRHYRPKKLKLFCAKSGAMNIIDDTLGSPLYGDDPIKQCREQVDKLMDNPHFSTLEFGINTELSDTFIHTKYVRELYSHYLECKERLDPLETVPDHIGSMVMFGVGLGYSLEPLFERVTVDHIYMIEPDRDLFFASLYTCDWEKILRTIDERDGLIMLNVGVSYEQFTTDFINEMKHRGAFNSVSTLLYQHYPSEDVNRIIKQLNNDFHLVAIGWGFFDDGVISIAHDYHNAKQELPTLRKSATLPRNLRHMPAFIVANGPSLDLVIEDILEYKDKVVIFSCGSAILPLLKHGIIPDFHVALERTRFTYDYYNEFIDKDIIEQINFLTVNVMHPKCAELFKWTGMGYKAAEPGTTVSCEFIDKNIKYQQLLHCNPVVANTALAFACYMGFEEIYLMGVDGGYKDPKYHHSKSSSYYTDDGEEKEDIAKLVRAGEIRVPGNFEPEVYTTAFFHVGNSQLGYLLKRFKNVNCFNCSDGAKIDNATPLHHEDLLIMDDLPDKEEFIEFVKKEQFPIHQHNDEEYIKWLAIDKFDEICDELIKYVDKEFTSRSEIAIALKLQVRYLYSYGYTIYRHLYFLLDGTITYVHAMFRMTLYSFASDEETIAAMHKAFDIFIRYMKEAKVKYQGVLTGTDEQRSYLMGMLNEKANENKVIS